MSASFVNWLVTLVTHVNSGVVSVYTPFENALKRLCTGVPVLSIPYIVVPPISVTVLATLLAVALCRQYKLESVYSRCSVLNVQCFWIAYWAFTVQANDEQHLCNVIAGCCTTLAPRDQQNGQLLSVCQSPECTCLSELNISCYPTNAPHDQQHTGRK